MAQSREFDVRAAARSHLANFQGFEPADPLEVMAARAGIPEDRIVRLNANENPYGPSPKVAEALQSLAANIYPDPQQRAARRAVSKATGADVEQIVVGAGSDEIIDLLFRLLVGPEDSVVECSPTFGMYGFGARLAGARCISVPRDDRFEIDLEDTLDSIDSTTKIVFLNSPNNPTGNLVQDAHLRAILDTGSLVVVDEAYYEYAGASFLDLTAQYGNLVVLRTLSKWAGLAGLRVGYGVMAPDLASALLDIKQPYNLTLAAEAGLIASLDDAEYLMENVRKIVAERDRLFGLLQALPGVEPWPSRANYILFKVPVGRAKQLFDGLASQGIFLRMFSHPRLKDHIRTSVGTPEQSDALIVALEELV